MCAIWTLQLIHLNPCCCCCCCCGCCLSLNTYEFKNSIMIQWNAFTSYSFREKSINYTPKWIFCLFAQQTYEFDLQISQQRHILPTLWIDPTVMMIILVVALWPKHTRKCCIPTLSTPYTNRVFVEHLKSSSVHVTHGMRRFFVRGIRGNMRFALEIHFILEIYISY